MSMLQSQPSSAVEDQNFDIIFPFRLAYSSQPGTPTSFDSPQWIRVLIHTAGAVGHSWRHF